MLGGVLLVKETWLHTTWAFLAQDILRKHHVSEANLQPYGSYQEKLSTKDERFLSPLRKEYTVITAALSIPTAGRGSRTMGVELLWAKLPLHIQAYDIPYLAH